MIFQHQLDCYWAPGHQSSTLGQRGAIMLSVSSTIVITVDKDLFNTLKTLKRFLLCWNFSTVESQLFNHKNQRRKAKANTEDQKC